MKDSVDHYIAEFRTGRCDDAFHGLIDQDPEIIHELISVYEENADLDIKVFVIKVASEFRKPTSLCFLRHALRIGDERVWKSALAGLAMAESGDAVDAMDHVLSSVTNETKRAWIIEAISDTNKRLKK